MVVNHRGRISIYTSETDFTDVNKIIDILNYSLPLHRQNVQDMDYLIDYYLGNQPVLNKEKTVRPEINNKIVVNLAYSAVRDVKGYTFGQPITYVPRNLEVQKELAVLNNANEYEHKSAVDSDVAEFMLITGLGYRSSFPDKNEDEQPFKYSCVDPRDCYIIRSTELGHEPVLAVIIERQIDLTGFSGKAVEKIRYHVYSKYSRFKFVVDAGLNPDNVTIENLETEDNNIEILKSLPIEEFRCNLWGLGFFETVMDVLNSLNLLASDTLDDIEQKVRSKLILLGVDPQQLEQKELDVDGKTEISFADKIKNSDVLVFSGQQGINQDAKFVTTNLDYNGVDTYREWLESMYYYLLGLPERRTRGNGGGDTGHAVELRDGWASLETVARNIELSWERSERDSIKRVLEIMKIKKQINNLKVTDIDIKFSRNKLDNLQSKAQSGQILHAMGLYDPTDITNIMNITTDPQGMIDRGKKYYEEKRKQDLKNMEEMNKIQGNIANTDDKGNDVNKPEQSDV